MLKAQAGDVVPRVKALIDDRKAMQNEIAQLKRQLAMGGGAEAAPKEIAGVQLIARRVDGVSGKELGALADQMRAGLANGAVVVMTEDNGKATVAAAVTPELSQRLSAVTLVQAAVAALGGKGGGGRPDRAQGGAPSLAALDKAVEAVERAIELSHTKYCPGVAMLGKTAEITSSYQLQDAE